MSTNILVTGANKGIGLAIVKKILTLSPDNFVFLGSRDQTRGQAAIDGLVTETPAFAGRIFLTVLDVTSKESIDAAFASVSAALQGATLYGIVNNAGGSGDGPQGHWEVNCKSAYVVTDTFLPLLQPKGGRLVNVSSGGAPSWVSKCSPEMQEALKVPQSWEWVQETAQKFIDLSAEGAADKIVAAGFPQPGFMMNDYGMAKALLNVHTNQFAVDHPNLTVASMSPGFVETDLTTPFATRSGKTPKEMGMITPDESAVTVAKLLFEELGGSGWYWGSDGQRSPMHKYRSPYKDPPYTGDDSWTSESKPL